MFHHATVCFQCPSILTHFVEIQVRNARNWIAIKSCVEKVRQLEHFLASSINASHGWFFSAPETQFLMKKLELVAEYVLNELWRTPESTEACDTDPSAGEAIFGILALNRALVTSNELQWMKSVDDYHVIVQDYNRDCFRDAMITTTNRRRYAVEGDGNCFYRAVIKCFWSNVSGSAESRLAQAVRTALNAPPSKKNDSSESTVDPYADFTIKEETDGKTMATAGVWADHVQVKKTADFLSRPIWIIRHDDSALRIKCKTSELEWDVSPGNEYKVMPEGATQQTMPPLVLFFTPEVHYDAFLMIHRSLYIAPLADLETHLLAPATSDLAKAHNLVHWCFEIESELAHLLDAHQRALTRIEPTEKNEKIRLDLAKIALTILRNFSVLVHVSRRLLSESPTLPQTISDMHGGKLTALAVKPIFDDQLVFQNPLSDWDNLENQVRTLTYSLKSLGSADPAAETPLSSIFNMLTTFFECLTSTTLVKRDRSELTASQSGAALLLASLTDQFREEPQKKRKLTEA